MRIGWDAKRAFRNLTGLGNYSRSVIHSMCRFFPENEYLLFSPDKKEKRPFSYKGKLITPAFQPSALWRSLFIFSDINKEKLDIFHGLSNEVPFLIPAKTKVVVTIHDLIFKRYPGYYPWFDRKMYDLKTRQACKRADRIICVSRQTAKDLIKFYHVDESKVEVVYQVCDPSFSIDYSGKEIKETKDKYSLPEKFILYVGTIEKRKNLATLVKAFVKVKDFCPDLKLVCLGKKTSYFEKEILPIIKEENLTNDIIFPAHIEFAELPMVYKAALLFCYPSEFEGFGIPVLEAVSAGVPVIAAKGSSLEEAGGDAAMYVSPFDTEGWKNKILELMQDHQLRASLIENGKKHTGNFSEKIMAENLNRIYHNLIHGK